MLFLAGLMMVRVTSGIRHAYRYFISLTRHAVAVFIVSRQTSEMMFDANSSRGAGCPDYMTLLQRQKKPNSRGYAPFLLLKVKDSDVLT
jgi:hypothetical protein